MKNEKHTLICHGSCENNVELLKYPYPYEAALTVASDIDNAS